MSNHSGVQAAIRAETGTAHPYNGDWLALFTADSIPDGTFNERMLAWINFKLSATHTSLPEAQQAFAEDQGFTNWSAMNTVVL